MLKVSLSYLFMFLSGLLPFSDGLTCYKCHTTPKGSKIPFQCDPGHTGVVIPCEGKHSVCAIRVYTNKASGMTTVQKYCLFEPVEGKAPPGKCIIDNTQEEETITDCFCLDFDDCNEYNIAGVGARSQESALVGANSGVKIKLKFFSIFMTIITTLLL